MFGLLLELSSLIRRLLDDAEVLGAGLVEEDFISVSKLSVVLEADEGFSAALHEAAGGGPYLDNRVVL